MNVFVIERIVRRVRIEAKFDVCLKLVMLVERSREDAFDDVDASNHARSRTVRRAALAYTLGLALVSATLAKH